MIEVALPLEAINAACKRDKDRKTGTIRNLHKWFAPMPSPAWRALLPAALIDDPGTPEERDRLFRLLENLVASDAKPPPRVVIDEARRLIKESVGEIPVVLDPFCGGGSTLVEAQRFGLPVCGSDLNPIPVLITSLLTSMLPSIAGRPPISGTEQEQITEIGSGLSGFVADASHYARRIYDEAKKRIGANYPLAPNGDPVIGWWWARTIRSPDPRFNGAMTPLVNDWWLSKRPGAEAFVSPVVDRDRHSISFEIRNAKGTAPLASKARCLYSEAPILFSYIKQEGQSNRLGTTLMALIAHGTHGRQHFPPESSQQDAAANVTPISPPTLDLPEGGLGFRVQEYGIRKWAQLFTERQLVELEAFADLVAEVRVWAQTDGADELYVQALVTFLGLCLGKLAQVSSMQVRLFIDSRNGSAKAQPAFSRPDISPLWDFVETNPFGHSVGDWMQVVDTAFRSLEFVSMDGGAATIAQMDARLAYKMVAPGSALIATDPPYFSNFGYADPSDYFYIWLRRALKTVHPDLFSTLGAPRTGELIADPTRHHGDKQAAKEYFIDGLRDTLAGLSRASRPDLPMLVVYAFKQQEASEGGIVSTGWEAVLDALIGAGLQVVGTWPIHGTGSARARGLSSNALATYVLLICRRREVDAPVATRREFQSALRAELGVATSALSASSIAPVDLAQAVVGPGMAVFSRYSKVVEADGQTMTVRNALGIINGALDEVLEQRDSDFEADSRWALAWFEQYGFGEGPFGAAESLSKAKNTAVNGLQADGILISRGGRVRLLSAVEMDQSWDPRSDPRITVWEVTHHLIRKLESEGEVQAAQLMRAVGGLSESARELSYRLYQICDRKKWAREAQSYNGLVVAWPEISRLAASATLPSGQQVLTL